MKQKQLGNDRTLDKKPQINTENKQATSKICWEVAENIWYRKRAKAVTVYETIAQLVGKTGEFLLDICGLQVAPEILRLE